MKTSEEYLKEYRQMFSEARESPEFWTRAAVWEFAHGIRRLLGGRKQSDLAKQMGVSEAYISDVLRCKRQGISLLKMNEIAHHFGAAVHIYVGDKDEMVPWAEAPTSETRPAAVGARQNEAPIPDNLVHANFKPTGRPVRNEAIAVLLYG